jgi:hypothetical protein
MLDVLVGGFAIVCVCLGGIFSIVLMWAEATNRRKEIERVHEDNML